MFNFLQQREMWSRFKKDTRGNFALVWAFGLTATLTAMGAGIDFSTASRVTTTSQAAADQIALHSAIFYSTHQRTPETNEEGFRHGTVYRGDDAGYNFPNSVRGGNRGVKFRVLYDEDNGEVSVDVYGRVNTAFMSMFNQDFKTLPFSSQATAKFKEVELKNPASITLVLDNSGSMAWDDKPAECENVWISTRFGGYWEEQCESPAGAERRIDGLTQSVNEFMDILDGYVGDQAVTGKRVLRTGMIPYDDQIISNREVDMDWGTISSSDVDRMSPSGATNSSPPISRAWDWLQDENDIHEAETGEDNPLRYMIFMTDGQNSAARQWFTQAGTNYWRGIQCTRNRWNNYCYYIYRDGSSQPNVEGAYGWQEGELISPSDRDSKNTCAAMKSQGVRVFTIGFALEPGTYLTNYRETFNNNSYAADDTRDITETTTNAAYAMLADCASSADDFVTAEDVETLEEAFAQIGSTIVEDVVRLSQ